MTSSFASQPAPFNEKRARKAALSSFIGAVVDWYDFLLYGIVAALVFKDQFFPSVSPTMGTLAAFATFGVGFLFRPLGGVVFGHFGDKIGRKKMLFLTVFLMGAATVMIGLLPNFAQIGWWAPVLLVTLRAIQGFAVGGEWGGAALMAVENAPEHKKAFYSSGVQIGYGVGLMLASGIVSLTIMSLGQDTFNEWGWRIPFLVSIVLVGIALWIRNDQEESSEFLQQAKKSVQQQETLPIIQAIKNSPKGFFFIIALRLAELLTMYLVTTFALNYSTQNLHMSSQIFLNISLMVGAISCFSIPFFAMMADRFGRRRMCIFGGLIGALAAFPFFIALQSGSLFWIVILSILLANLAHDMVVSVHQPIFTELFGAEYRYSGAGVGYQIASIVGGGFTPFIASALIAIAGGHWILVAIYLTVGCLLTAIVASKMKAHVNEPSHLKS
ncbi:shikimate transporter [Acinetobacter puyangensis]|uniref:MFS transporter, MHS family, shikimate and dehydroshikimate transport protein n=1 Tax=Acinetobacter puyangensis TaxID=1096779 RepID=A0A240ECR6_9GAMM|nr:shikimate transporter [Acinetobacter puyangensis]SNX46508.1 MFS transporter, MHS family, shikimate and dehydroshikimate transport protein [Acinetobacter puyangensis]